MTIALVALWIACGITSYGMVVGFYQGNFPILAHRDRYFDRILAAYASLLGPVALIAALVILYPYRWRL